MAMYHAAVNGNLGADREPHDDNPSWLALKAAPLLVAEFQSGMYQVWPVKGQKTDKAAAFAAALSSW